MRSARHSTIKAASTRSKEKLTQAIRPESNTKRHNMPKWLIDKQMGPETPVTTLPAPEGAVSARRPCCDPSGTLYMATDHQNKKKIENEQPRSRERPAGPVQSKAKALSWSKLDSVLHFKSSTFRSFSTGTRSATPRLTADPTFNV